MHGCVLMSDFWPLLGSPAPPYGFMKNLLNLKVFLAALKLMLASPDVRALVCVHVCVLGFPASAKDASAEFEGLTSRGLHWCFWNFEFKHFI